MSTEPTVDVQSLADLGSLLEVAPPSEGAITPQSDLAQRARAWFLEAINHPLWVNYIREADEDQGFYTGGQNQWSKEGSKEDVERLNALGKAVVTINHIKPIVDVLVGFERQNRFDIKAVPQGIEDDEDAKILSWLLKFAQEQSEIGEALSDGFKAGLIRGMVCYDVGIDWTTDPVNGEVVVDVLKPGRDVIWDPHWKKYDLSDAAYLIRFRWVRVSDLVAMYPEHRTEIESAVSALHPIAEAFTARTTDGPAGDAYGGTTAHPIEDQNVEQQFYDPALRRLLVLEPWWLTYEAQWVVTDKTTGTVQEFDDSAVAKTYAASDPTKLTAIKRLRRKICTGTVIPATRQTLEESESPYDNDLEHYPQVPFFADKVDDEIMGVVRNLKDPQRVENKRISQCMDIVSRYGNLRVWAEENAVVNPDSVKNPHSTDIIWVKSGRKPPGFLVPEGLAQLVNMLVELSQQMKTAPREISGINTDLLGIKGDTSSGIAIARRQAQGQVIAAPYFDNLRRTRKIVGQRLARRIQQRYSTAQVLRLINDEGLPVAVSINPPEYREMDAKTFRERMVALPPDPTRPHILRDVSALKYDVTISESPTTPTARQGALLTILDLLKTSPEYFPVFAETVLELADIPDRQKLLQKLRLMQGGPPPGGGPAAGGPPGAPPGAPVGPGAPSSVPAAAPLPVPPVLSPPAPALPRAA